jgi:surfactin synthase thioesterase subunit
VRSGATSTRASASTAARHRRLAAGWLAFPAGKYPGRQDRRDEKPITDLSLLADQVYAVLRHQPELPLVFFGHSMGASLAFEVIRRLEADNHAPGWTPRRPED